MWRKRWSYPEAVTSREIYQLAFLESPEFFQNLSSTLYLSLSKAD